jgi:hypothetical protein
MPLAPGTPLGQYEVLSLLGAALGILAQFPYLGVEWEVRKSYAGLARMIGDSAAAGEHTSRAVRELKDGRR